MKRFISLLLAAMLLFSLCACSDGGSGKDKDKDNDGDTVSAICFEYDCDSADMYANNGTYDAVYFSYMLNPARVVDGVSAEAAANINKVLDKSYADAAEYCDEFQESAYSAYLDDSMFAAYTYDYRVEVERCDESVISVIVSESVYAGGAHGSYGKVTFNFSAKTGELLSVDDITDDGNALAEHIASYIQSAYSDTVKNNEPDLSQVSKLIENGQWYFTNEGLIVFAQPYEIASFAAGMPTFTVPYDELESFVHKNILPEGRSESGDIKLSDKGDKVAEFIINAEGENFCLAAEGTVYDVRVYEALMSDGGYIGLEGCVYYRNVMSDGEYISVTRYIPDAYCNIIIVYNDADGVEHSYGVAQSGKDGSVFLTENWQ